MPILYMYWYISNKLILGGQYTSNIGTLCPKQRTIFRHFLQKGNEQFSQLHISTFQHITSGSCHVQPLSTLLSVTQQIQKSHLSHLYASFSGRWEGFSLLSLPNFSQAVWGGSSIPIQCLSNTKLYTCLYPQVIPNIWPISITFRPEFLRMRRRPIHMSVRSIWLQVWAMKSLCLAATASCRQVALLQFFSSYVSSFMAICSSCL